MGKGGDGREEGKKWEEGRIGPHPPYKDPGSATANILYIVFRATSTC